MKEKLYTIPINDAFALDCECPVCAIYQKLEKEAVDFTMGPSYMEDDVRMETDRLGFCSHHMRLLTLQENKLGLALMMKTHLDKTNKETEKKMKLPVSGGSGFFKKQAASDPLLDYLDELENSCFICARIENTYARYLHTLVLMWKTDPAFRETYKSCKGFCNRHLAALLKDGSKTLSKDDYAQFRQITCDVYLTNMKRMDEDLEWFTNKFDYRYKDEPWKNAKDALVRGVVKTNSLLELKEEK